jgi:hypothetical protein
MAFDSDLPIDASGENIERARSEALDLLAENPTGRKTKPGDNQVRPSPQIDAEALSNSANPSSVQKRYQYEALYPNGRVRYSINSDGTTFGVLQTNPDDRGRYTETHYGHSNSSENFTATITPSRSGTTTISYDNGGKRVVHKDGSGYIQSPRAKDGNYDVTVFGPQGTPRFKVNVVRTADGGSFYSYDDGSWRKTSPDGSKAESIPLANSRTREERQFDSSGRIRRVESVDKDKRATIKEVTEKDILTELIDTKISRPEIRKIFHDSMNQFETRAQKDQLSSKEIAATYREVSRLLDAEGGDRAHPDRFAALAGHVLRNASRPEQISSGDHHTERVTAVESTIYGLNPSAAAKLVADVGLNGSFFDSKKNYVKIDATPHDTSRTFFPKDGERNHASEIFQVTAVNLALSERRLRRELRMEYAQTNPENREDTGERMLIRAQDGSLREVLDRGIPVRRPRLTDEDIASLSFAISSKAQVPYLAHLLNASGGGNGVTKIMSLQELHETLAEQSRNSPGGELNALAKVYAINEPFWSERRHKITNLPDATQEQTITITRFIPGDGTNWGFVEVNSQTGTSGVHEGRKAIPLQDLYRAMQTVDKNIPSLKKDIERSGNETFDPLKQVDLLRLEVSDGRIGDREAAVRLNVLARRCAVEWRDNDNSLNNDVRKKLISGFDDIALHLPTRFSLKVIDQERVSGLLNNQEYDQRLAILAWQVRREQARDALWDRRINNAENRRRLAEVYSYIHPLSEQRKTAIENKISELLILYP